LIVKSKLFDFQEGLLHVMYCTHVMIAQFCSSICESHYISNNSAELSQSDYASESAALYKHRIRKPIVSPQSNEPSAIEARSIYIFLDLCQIHVFLV
jgi:hypothetical protein